MFLDSPLISGQLEKAMGVSRSTALSLSPPQKLMAHQRQGHGHVGVRVMEKARLDKPKTHKDVIGYDRTDLAVIVPQSMGTCSIRRA